MLERVEGLEAVDQLAGLEVGHPDAGDVAVGAIEVTGATAYANRQPGLQNIMPSPFSWASCAFRSE